MAALKQYRFMILQFWETRVQNVSHWAMLKVPAGLCSFCRRIHLIAFSGF